MSVPRALLVAAIAAGGVHYWHRHEAAADIAGAGDAVAVAGADEFGFVDVPVQDQNPDSVYIVAAVDCPRAAAQRADRLAKDLSAKGIPVIRTDHWRYQWNGTDRTAANAVAKRLNAVGSGPLPIVFVRGRAKGAPTLDEVVAEFTSK